MLKNITNNEFWKNVITLLSASVLAQAIPFMLLPILQKWFFTPSDFGILAIYTSISLLLASIASFKYELAIVNEESDDNAQHLFWGSAIIALIFTIVITIILKLFTKPISELFKAEELGNYIMLIPLTIIFVSFGEILNFWNNRKKEFKTIAAAKISKSITAESSKLILGKISLNNGLIIGRIIGEFFSLLFLLINFIRYDLASFTKFNFDKTKHILKKNYRFPTFSMPSVFVGNFINVVFIALISRYFGTTAAGIIGVSVVYVAVAFGIMSQAFSQVFFKEIHEHKSRKELLNFYLKNAAILSTISILIIIIVEIIPSNAIVFILGEQWIEMVATLKILVFAYGAQFITSSLSFIYIRLNKQRTMLIFDILHLAMIWISIVMAYKFYGSYFSVIIAYTIAQIMYYLIAFIAAIVFINKAKLQQ